MVSLAELMAYLDELLQPQGFSDYCPNGLQIEGKPIVKTLVSGVSVSQQLIDAAIQLQADAILVHHGFFWRGEDPRIVGIKQQRIAKLLERGISLIGYHLPLDAHPVYGNNVQLAKRLEIEIEHSYPVNGIANLLWIGSLDKVYTGEAFAEKIAVSLQRQPLHLAAKDKLINKVAWCTGAAQDFFEQSIGHGIDAYLTGEVSERNFHLVEESGVHFYAAGHHATERYGVQALADHLAHYFGIQQHYVEIPNPI